VQGARQGAACLGRAMRAPRKERHGTYTGGELVGRAGQGGEPPRRARSTRHKIRQQIHLLTSHGLRVPPPDAAYEGGCPYPGEPGLWRSRLTFPPLPSNAGRAPGCRAAGAPTP
jgi:hypothetical protein